MPRWNIDHVLVRYLLTNNVYRSVRSLLVIHTHALASRFPCGRWLGKGVDDDSLERLLFVDSIGSIEMNENPANGQSASGSPSPHDPDHRVYDAPTITVRRLGGRFSSCVLLSKTSERALQILSSLGFREMSIVVRIA